MVAHVNQMDQIASMLRLKRQFGFRLIVLGGAEAHLLADRLAAENVSVILNPSLSRLAPDSYEKW